jgi:hypothetical protein
MIVQTGMLCLVSFILQSVKAPQPNNKNAPLSITLSWVPHLSPLSWVSWLSLLLIPSLYHRRNLGNQCIFCFITAVSYGRKMFINISTTYKLGGRSLSITTFSIMTFSITINKMRHSAQWQSVVMLSVIMLNGTNNPFILSVIMLNIIMLIAECLIAADCCHEWIMKCLKKLCYICRISKYFPSKHLKRHFKTFLALPIFLK